jgi:hypothetical protein
MQRVSILRLTPPVAGLDPSLERNRPAKIGTDGRTVFPRAARSGTSAFGERLDQDSSVESHLSRSSNVFRSVQLRASRSQSQTDWTRPARQSRAANPVDQEFLTDCSLLSLPGILFTTLPSPRDHFPSRGDDRLLLARPLR